MSTPESDDLHVDVDRLSDLPEPLILHILSFVPTKFAIRTSVVSRRFRYLWMDSPSMDINRDDFPPGRTFTSATSRCLRLRKNRKNPAPLVSFSLKAYGSVRNLGIKTASKWLNNAYSLGLRTLCLNIYTADAACLLPLILTFQFLQSLKITSLDIDGWFRSVESLIPPNFLATGLRSLHLQVQISCSDLKRLVMEQTGLEDLCLELPIKSTVDLVSRTVKSTKLKCRWLLPEMKLFFPALEVLDLTIAISSDLMKFYGEMPLLRKADIKLLFLTEENVSVLGDMLKCFANVSQLSIRIDDAFPRESKPLPGSRWPCLQKELDKRQFHLPAFPHLRSLNLMIPFHEASISDLICFLQNAAVLESLEVNHVENYKMVDRGWMSKLPRDSEGNNQRARFSNLHLGDWKIELIQLLVSCNEAQDVHLETEVMMMQLIGIVFITTLNLSVVLWCLMLFWEIIVH